MGSVWRHSVVSSSHNVNRSQVETALWDASFRKQIVPLVKWRIVNQQQNIVLPLKNVRGGNLPQCFCYVPVGQHCRRVHHPEQKCFDAACTNTTRNKGLGVLSSYVANNHQPCLSS